MYGCVVGADYFAFSLGKKGLFYFVIKGGEGEIIFFGEKECGDFWGEVFLVLKCGEFFCDGGFVFLGGGGDVGDEAVK